jgi:Glyoxalase-like domain
MLELDHVFCMVGDLDEVANRVENAGWTLDSGSVHSGQGTRNRRLVWPERYLELVGITDRREAGANRMRMDRRADWASTGASPIGFGLRGELAAADRGAYWLYEDLGIRIWVHRDNEQAPERPLVFVLEMNAAQLVLRRARLRGANRGGQPRGSLEAIHVQATAPARLPICAGPRLSQSRGAPQLELVAGPGPARSMTDILAICG